MERKKIERTRGKSIDVKRNSNRNKLSNRELGAEDAKENNSNTNKISRNIEGQDPQEDIIMRNLMRNKERKAIRDRSHRSMSRAGSSRRGS